MEAHREKKAPANHAHSPVAHMTKGQNLRQSSRKRRIGRPDGSPSTARGGKKQKKDPRPPFPTRCRVGLAWLAAKSVVSCLPSALWRQPRPAARSVRPVRRSTPCAVRSCGQNHPPRWGRAPRGRGHGAAGGSFFLRPAAFAAGQDHPVIECRRLRAGYGRREVLAGIDLTVSRGEMVGLLGPNGAGKTTLLLTLTGALAPMAPHSATTLHNKNAPPNRKGWRGVERTVSGGDYHFLRRCSAKALACSSYVSNPA